MNIKNNYLGEIISEIRKEKGISLEILGQKSELHRTSISLIERGERIPTIETVERIANALNLTLIELLQLRDGKILLKRTANPEYLIKKNIDILKEIDVTPETILDGITHCYKTLDLIDEQLMNSNSPKLSEIVELANLSSIVGNFLGAGLANCSNGIYKRNKPHTYPDLIRTDGSDNGIEIKLSLDRNLPKGHHPKSGYYITCRYSLARDGKYSKGREFRGDTVYFWEVKCDYLTEDDFLLSNTKNDSGKTAIIKTPSLNNMRLIYFDPSMTPYNHSINKPYVGYK